jgi:hypothetical protein
VTIVLKSYTQKNKKSADIAHRAASFNFTTHQKNARKTGVTRGGQCLAITSKPPPKHANQHRRYRAN